MIAPWVLGLAASAVITMTFLAIAVLLAVNLTRLGHWRVNPLAVGTFLVFLTCAVGHALHTLQLLAPSIGFDAEAGNAARAEYGQWHVWAWDAVTAAAGAWYWLMRRKFPDLVAGTTLYEDLREREKRAIEIHEKVLRGLDRARRSLDQGQKAEGHQAVDETLKAAKRIITDLLGEKDLQPGQLRREDAASREG